MKKIILLILITFDVNFAQAQWQRNNLDTIGANCIIVNDSTVFVGTQGGVYISIDSGLTWALSNNGFPQNAIVSSLAIKGANIFAGTYSNGVFVSINHGGFWTQANIGLTDTIINTLVVSGTNIFAGTHGGIFLSTNNGGLWNAVNNGIANSQIFSLATDGVRFFAGGDSGAVFLSTNNGALWTSIDTGLPSSTVLSLTISGTNIFAGTFGGGVFLSTNDGGLWNAVNIGLTNTYVHTLAISGTNIFAGTHKGVFLSANYGNLWTEINTGWTTTFDTIVMSIAMDGSNIFAALGLPIPFDQLWSRPLSEVITGIEENNHNNSFTIYPNPSNGKYFLKLPEGIKNSEINIFVYNLLGELIMTTKTQISLSQVDLRNQPKGIYLLRMRQEGKIYNGKLVIE